MYQLEFIWMREEEEATELVTLAEVNSPVIPRLGESVEFDLPELESEELPDTWVIVDVRYIVERGVDRNEVSPRITLFVDIPLEEEE